VRARLSKRLAELVPGDLNTFFFTLGGAEANENAIKAARLFTGRHKILARYRSYHGATHGAMSLTGDPRRWPNEPGMAGFVRVMDPHPYDYSFGATDEEVVPTTCATWRRSSTTRARRTIAAMFIETVTGTNGILPPPKGYLAGPEEALLDKYGILLVCDEVMCGWGRTGKLFAFEHGNIVPDIVTMAKGLTSSYLPLGVMAVSDRHRQPLPATTSSGVASPTTLTRCAWPPPRRSSMS
jgi:taurine--2-oxoglutarate transaminase